MEGNSDIPNQFNGRNILPEDPQDITLTRCADPVVSKKMVICGLDRNPAHAQLQKDQEDGVAYSCPASSSTSMYLPVEGAGGSHPMCPSEMDVLMGPDPTCVTTSQPAAVAIPESGPSTRHTFNPEEWGHAPGSSVPICWAGRTDKRRTLDPPPLEKVRLIREEHQCLWYTAAGCMAKAPFKGS